MKKLSTRIATAALFAVLAAPATADPAANQPTAGDDPGAKIEFLRDMALRDSWAATQIVPTLENLTRDADADTRLAAAQALESIGSQYESHAPGCLDALTALARDPDQAVRGAAVNGIKGIASMNAAMTGPAFDAFYAIALDATLAPDVRMYSAGMFSSFAVATGIRADDATELSLAMLRDADENVRAAAVMNIWGLALRNRAALAPGAVATLAPLRNDPSEIVRAAADRYIRLLECTSINPNECLAP